MKKMSKCKVGDVSALFSTPNEATSEAGKKLQSLFKEFHNKNKGYAQPYQDTKKKENNVEKGSEANQNQRMSKKKKKRKFSGVTSPESNTEDSNTKKFKMTTEQVDATSAKRNEKKKNKSLAEQNFPRKKKTSKMFDASNVKYSGFNEFEVEETFSDVEQGSDATFKTKNKSKGKKQVSGFIKNSKQKKLVTANHTVEIQDTEILSNEDTLSISFDSDGSFRDEVKEFIKKNTKELLKKGNRDNFVSSSQFNIAANDCSESQVSKEYEQISNKQSFNNSDTSFKNEVNDSVRSAKKLKKERGNDNNFVSSSQFNTVANDYSESQVSKEYEQTSNKRSFNNSDTFRSAKKLKKKRGNDNNFVSSSQFNTVADDCSESQVSKEYEQTSNKKSFNNSVTSFKNEVKDFVRSAKKLKEKNNGDNFIGNSQPRISEGELDFVKIPGIKSEDEEDKLSRTLFIGNLPVKTNKRALKTLFSPFGDIQQIRYHGVETDKARIFSEDGTKSLNPNNYAADSVPGYVVYKDRQSAISALSLSGSLFKDHHITVDFALPIGAKRIYDGKRSIFIGNLPFGCKDESVWEAFTECGRIEGVRIVRDKETGIGKGFGYVHFSTVEAKEKALALEDLMIGGRSIRIKVIESDKAAKKKVNNTSPVKRNTFKSHAIRLKMKNKESGSRKSVKKIMKKQKNLHQKKKIANIIQKGMKSS